MINVTNISNLKNRAASSASNEKYYFEAKAVPFISALMNNVNVCVDSLSMFDGDRQMLKNKCFDAINSYFKNSNASTKSKIDKFKLLLGIFLVNDPTAFRSLAYQAYAELRTYITSNSVERLGNLAKDLIKEFAKFDKPSESNDSIALKCAEVEKAFKKLKLLTSTTHYESSEITNLLEELAPLASSTIEGLVKVNDSKNIKRFIPYFETIMQEASNSVEGLVNKINCLQNSAQSYIDAKAWHETGSILIEMTEMEDLDVRTILGTSVAKLYFSDNPALAIKNIQANLTTVATKTGCAVAEMLYKLREIQIIGTETSKSMRMLSVSYNNRLAAIILDNINKIINDLTAIFNHPMIEVIAAVFPYAESDSGMREALNYFSDLWVIPSADSAMMDLDFVKLANLTAATSSDSNALYYELSSASTENIKSLAEQLKFVVKEQANMENESRERVEPGTPEGAEFDVASYLNELFNGIKLELDKIYTKKADHLKKEMALDMELFGNFVRTGSSVANIGRIITIVNKFQDLAKDILSSDESAFACALMPAMKIIKTTSEGYVSKFNFTTATEEDFSALYHMLELTVSE